MDEDEEPEIELTGDAGAPVDVSRVPVIVSVSQVKKGGGAPVSSSVAAVAVLHVGIGNGQQVTRWEHGWHSLPSLSAARAQLDLFRACGLESCCFAHVVG